jgi:hypothetical protein
MKWTNDSLCWQEINRYSFVKSTKTAKFKWENFKSLAMALVDPSVRLAVSQPWKKYETAGILQTYMLRICEVLEGYNLIDVMGKAEHCNADRIGGTS